MKLRVLLALTILLIFAGTFLRREVPPSSIDNSATPTLPANRSPRFAEPLPMGEAEKPDESEEPDLVLAPQLDLADGTLAWEQRIESVLRADQSEAAKARRLIAMLRQLPEEALETATRQAVDRLPDKEYAPARTALLNPQTHGAAMTVLFADLMERPDEIALPTLLAIARIPSHPWANSARENLDLLLGKDFGSDWLKWDEEVRRALAAQR